MFLYRRDKIFGKVPEIVKILWLIAFIVLIFLWQNIFFLMSLLAINIILLLLIRFSASQFRKLLSVILPFIILTNMVFVFFGRRIIGNLFEFLLLVDLRVMILFSSLAFFSSTTDLISVYYLMNRIRIPKCITLSFYITLRFLPEIEKSYKEISDLQKIRGITIRNPIKYLKSIFTAIIINLLDRAQELTIAFYLRDKYND